MRSHAIAAFIHIQDKKLNTTHKWKYQIQESDIITHRETWSPHTLSTFSLISELSPADEDRGEVLVRLCFSLPYSL